MFSIKILKSWLYKLNWWSNELYLTKHKKIHEVRLYINKEDTRRIYF